MHHQTKGNIYLIPNTLGDTPTTQVLPSENALIIKNIRYFVVENIRSARRFLKKVDKEIDISQLTFFELNKHTSPLDVESYITPIEQGFHIGVLSEAGCPAIADPGAILVKLAHKKGIKVVPLVGPSSIVLALMASGFNGQNFAFHGYLPIDGKERSKKIKLIEGNIYSENQTQIFIETPYRNNKLLQDLCTTCKPHTLICVASNLTCEDESIIVKPAKDWQKSTLSKEKKPAIFLLYK